MLGKLFLGMRIEKQENLVTTGMIEEKRSRGKQLEKMLDVLSRRVRDALKETRDRDLRGRS